MTEPKIAGLLENFGIVISSGQISAWLTDPYSGIQEEKRRKDRLTILDVLRNGRPRVFRIHEEALDLLLRFSVSQRVIEQVRQLPFHRDWSQEEFQPKLAEQIPDLSEGAARPDSGGSGAGGVPRRERARAPFSM